ncbi:MAG: hypothetical protein Q9224_006765 [Gallowayella concinna]
MGKRKRTKPPPPDNLPEAPAASLEKAYYPRGDVVWFVIKGTDEWRTGTVAPESSGTVLHWVCRLAHAIFLPRLQTIGLMCFS